MCLSASLHQCSRDWGRMSEKEWGVGKRQPGNSPQHLSLKPPLLHLTLCPGSPDKPTNTHIHPHKCTHKHTDKPGRTSITPQCTEEARVFNICLPSTLTQHVVLNASCGSQYLTIWCSKIKYRNGHLLLYYSPMRMCL